MTRKIKLPIITVLLIGLIFHSCSNREGSDIDKIVEDYYQTYNTRQEIEEFILFYDESIVLEDIINGDRIAGKEALRNFFDWGNPNFKSLDTINLMVNEKIIKDNKAVIKGYSARFQWGGTEFGFMHFTTILTFNESGKIIKQVDWINYPSNLVDYDTRKNSNRWIK